jgi:hypothetical protein
MAAVLADEQRLKIGQPDVIGPAIGADDDCRMGRTCSHRNSQ